MAFDSHTFLAQVPHHPGVYQMFNQKGDVIYVGKAKDLNLRLKSYFNRSEKTLKTERLVSHIDRIEYILTHSEVEALLLEQSYIKKFLPRYNVLLKDNKAYPYIQLTHEASPQLSLFRGTPDRKRATYFGPYPNGFAVKQILALMQTLFPLRQCPKTTFMNRSRPCLQYQIHRCLGPCVKGLVSDDVYAEQVQLATLFLRGKTEEVLQQLTQKMEIASSQLHFEDAARYRDQIKSIKHLNQQQSLYNQHDSLDAIGFYFMSGIACFYLLFIRQGQPIGHRHFFPKVPQDSTLDEVVESFLTQFYLSDQACERMPYKILLNYSLSQPKVIEETLSHVAHHHVTLVDDPKGDNQQLLRLAIQNAELEVNRKLKQSTTMTQRYQALATFLGLPSIQRMECFDISHFTGKSTVASCVVFDEKGPVKSQFRRYTITNITPGDDYAAMRQVLLRRYAKPDLAKEQIPDVIFIDGGKGQLKQAQEVFDALDVSWNKQHPRLIGVAKGSERKEGLETLFFETHGEGVYLDSHSPALLLIQHIRNASHDHAITGQRQRQVKQLSESALEQIEGIGTKRRQALLRHFGGLRALQQASIDEIAQVQGISKALATHIHTHLPR